MIVYTSSFLEPKLPSAGAPKQPSSGARWGPGKNCGAIERDNELALPSHVCASNMFRINSLKTPAVVLGALLFGALAVAQGGGQAQGHGGRGFGGGFGGGRGGG